MRSKAFYSVSCGICLAVIVIGILLVCYWMRPVTPLAIARPSE